MSRRDETNRTWIKNRIEKYEFVENQDYLVAKIGEQLPSGTKYKTEYYITLDLAKHLAMEYAESELLERELARYFILSTPP